MRQKEKLHVNQNVSLETLFFVLYVVMLSCMLVCRQISHFFTPAILGNVVNH